MVIGFYSVYQLCHDILIVPLGAFEEYFFSLAFNNPSVTKMVTNFALYSYCILLPNGTLNEDFGITMLNYRKTPLLVSGGTLLNVANIY